MKKSFIILLIAICGSALSGQEPGNSTVKYLKFHAGYQNRMLRDEQKSALTYASKELTGGLSFTRNGQRSVAVISLDAGSGSYTPAHIKGRWLYNTSYDINGNEKTDSFPLVAHMITGKLQLTYLVKVNPGNKLVWTAGASLKELLLYPDNYTGLLNSLGIHARVGLMQRIGSRSVINGDISFPIIAVNSRLRWHNTATSPLDPEIVTFFRKGSRIVTLDKFRMLDINLEYDYTISRHWSLGASWSFNWLSIPYYQPLKSYMNSLRIQTAYIF